ncbi:hypothetical protein B566_EDAN015946 [Ephemera danica]|nr:hypothetical protein B566_EDAN015946 [Ephemera danica]
MAGMRVLLLISTLMAMTSSYYLPCEIIHKVDCSTQEINSPHPHESDCSLYYICTDHFEPILETCFEGEIFNTELESCYFTTEPCLRCQSQEFAICEPTPTCDIFDFDVYKPFPPNCSQYIHCDAGILFLETCPDDTEFSPTQLECMDPSIANCTDCEPVRTRIACETTPSCSIFDIAVEKPYPPDCTKYLFCDSGLTQIKSCPSGEEFSPTENSCMSPDLAECPNCNPTTTIPPMSDVIESNSTIPSAICEPTPNCSLYDLGIKKPYPPDCTKYVYCDGGTSTIKDCSPGQEFSPTQKKCTTPELANCPVCIVPTTTLPPTTTTTPATTTPPPPICEPTPTCTVEEIK